MAKKKEEKTNVCRILDRQKIPYVFRTYEDEDPLSTREYGLHVAEALGENAEQCFKTLVARGASGAVLVFAIPVAETLDLKAAAKAAAPSILWPQPWPAPPGSRGRGEASPAAWLRPERASNSPRMPITGLPEPKEPEKAVGMPPRFSLTEKPSARSFST